MREAASLTATRLALQLCVRECVCVSVSVCSASECVWEMCTIYGCVYLHCAWLYSRQRKILLFTWVFGFLYPLSSSPSLSLSPALFRTRAKFMTPHTEFCIFALGKLISLAIFALCGRRSVLEGGGGVECGIRTTSEYSYKRVWLIKNFVKLFVFYCGNLSSLLPSHVMPVALSKNAALVGKLFALRSDALATLAQI